MYIDAIIICQNGLAPFALEAEQVHPKFVIGEGADRELNPLLNAVIPVRRLNNPAAIMIRTEKQYMQIIAAHDWVNAILLVEHPIKGTVVQTGVDAEGNPTFRKVDIYEALENAPAKYNIYKQLFPPYPEYVEDGQGEVIYTDIEGVPTPTPHPNAGKIKPFGAYM
jgi:hypothetical protein